MGGMIVRSPGVLTESMHVLALSPASATELSPPMAHNAMLEVVLNMGTSRPMRFRHVVQAVDRIHPANVKNVEWPAGLAVGIVFRHEHDINQPDRPVLI